MDINLEKLEYLLNDMEEHLTELIDKVLSDSEIFPDYSAVAATNRIKCYIQIMHELGEILPYNNVEEFFKFNAYTQDEYDKFETIRQKESIYYRGIQY